MYVNMTSAASLPVPVFTREEMAAIAAARPAVLQQQQAALAAANLTAAGTTGQGTPAVDGTSGLDVYA
jgi:hypothetical protein